MAERLASLLPIPVKYHNMKISVVTPSYNQGQFIERTINSVLSQGITDLQYIVMDGGSTDNTRSILEQYANRNQLQFTSEADRGQTHAINKALALADGDIIGWLNSDDIYYPNALQLAHDFFMANPNTDIIYGKAYMIDEHDQIIEPYITHPWSFEHLIKDCYISQPAVFMRRRLIERMGPLDESLNFCMDYEYWIRMGKMSVELTYISTFFAGARVHANAKTMSAAPAMQYEVILMLLRHLGFVHARWFLTYAYACTRALIAPKVISLKQAPTIISKATKAAIQTVGMRAGIYAAINFPIALITLFYKKWKQRCLRQKVCQ